MTKFAVLAVCGALAVSACAPQGPALGPDGKPLPQVYRTTDEAAVAYRLLDSVNSLRQARGAAPLEMNAELRAAAATHSRDMSVQNRPWHFGSDGSSPLVRVQRAGYPGKLMGELISETYQTELETLAAWMAQPDTREVVLDPKANQMGFAWYQEPAGKIWWTMVTGAGVSATAPFQIAGQ
ncbi:CAP domain-containing protein [Cereibacter changlensis]|uniref:CAP domain-containing protein n=1 Tax=Cereibacter changlensis TaxID=402884 RepID=A0A4U0YYA5_9RHOB|nr:CAP domain-containing protein [Cereibacter changlensis]TKA95666.1 CAP domain-containing protein [Cereibacter changlensis]